MASSNHAFSAFSFITFLLVLIPLPWHLEAWNTGTVVFMGWTALATLNSFINSVIWDNDAIDWAPVWCDISTRIIVGTAIGIPCASLCINRRLYYIASMQTIATSKRDKIKGIIVDCSIGILIPIIAVALHYVVQSHRYNIYEEIGCYPATYNVTLTYVFVQAPALIVPAVSTTYAIMSFIHLKKQRTEFKTFLASSAGSSCTASRYFRLMALSSTEILISFPVALTFLIMNATQSTVHPWISWEDTHFGFFIIGQIPAIMWKRNPSSRATLELSRWLPVIVGILFFAFFGFADEAKKNYKKGLERCFKVLGIKSPFNSKATIVATPSSSFGHAISSFSNFKSFNSNGLRSTGDLPVYISKEVIKKHDSLDFDSISDITIGSIEEEDTKMVSSENLADTTILPTEGRTSFAVEDSLPTHFSSMERRNASRISFPASVTPESESSCFPVPSQPLPAVSVSDTSFLEIMTPAADSVFRKTDNMV